MELLFELNIFFKPELEKQALRFLMLLDKFGWDDFDFTHIYAEVALGFDLDERSKKLYKVIFSKNYEPWDIIRYLKKEGLIEKGFLKEYTITPKGKNLIQELKSLRIFIRKVGLILLGFLGIKNISVIIDVFEKILKQVILFIERSFTVM